MKRALQVTIAILSLVPLSIGAIGILLGTSRWLPANIITPDFDSHYRYIAGYYVSLGLLGLWIIPKIEQHTGLFRVICASVFMGGMGRVASILQVGLPGPMAIFFTGFELCFPLLIWWQTRVSRLQHDRW
jgi:Na+/H+ antiporter NhaD/arsenite permease-like protein